MKQELAERASFLLAQIEALKDVQQVCEDAKTPQRWKLVSPIGVVELPYCLCRALPQATCEWLDKLTKELEEL